MRFYAYFKESVVESRLENARVRKITIQYFLEDKSVALIESKQSNSGIPQGQFLKRQVVLKGDGTPFMPDDFSIGIDVAIVGRAMRIYDCDQYTRRFYEVSFDSNSNCHSYVHPLACVALSISFWSGCGSCSFNFLQSSVPIQILRAGSG